MTIYGVTDQGFIPEPLAQSNADILAAFQAAFGADIDTSANGPFGLLAGIIADRESTLWQLAQAVYNAAYPDSAAGVQLDDVCSLTGVTRLPATKSADSVVFVGANGTVVPSGTVVATNTSGVQFSTTATSTIATLLAYSVGQPYSVGALVQNGGNVYSCTVAIPASVTAPTGTGPSADNGGSWLYVGAGSAAVAISCVGVTTGPLAAPSGTISAISTPVAGLTLVKNPLDAVPGTNIETHAALRLRRAQLLQSQGSGPVAAIRAALLLVSAVTSAGVFENPGDTVDGSGRPPHSVECVVSGAADAVVATAIYNAKGGGIQTTGSYAPQSVTDPATGQVYTIKFTRPAAVPIYVVVNLKKGAAWPAAGVAAVQAAVVAYANGQVAAIGNLAFVPGQTVYAGPIGAAIFDQLPGTQVADITSVYIGTAPAPGSSASITLTIAQVAVFDTSRVTVNAT